VLRLLLSRLQDGSAPGSRSDGFKLGLVVEGGGMRGIVTGAMLMGLQDMGLVNVFDSVYGEFGAALDTRQQRGSDSSRLVGLLVWLGSWLLIIFAAGPAMCC
jgi:hypothetical protein